MIEQYLVVCPNKKRAHILWRRLRERLVRNRVRYIRFYDTNKYYVIDSLKEQTRVCFVSERQFYEASRGYNGWVVDEDVVEKWLDAAESGGEV